MNAALDDKIGESNLRKKVHPITSKLQASFMKCNYFCIEQEGEGAPKKAYYFFSIILMKHECGLV